MSFERKTDLLPKRLQEICKEIEADFKVNEMNIHEQSLRSPALKSKWLMIRFEEKRLLSCLEKGLDQKLDNYVASHGKLGVPRKLTEKAALDEADIAKLKTAVEDQKLVVDFLVGFMDISKVFNFDLKNAVDIIKVEK